MNKKFLALVSVFCSLLAGAAVELPATWADYQKLEGADNKGAASLAEEGARVTVAGAVAAPFALGGTNASLAAQVRFLMPEKGKIPEWASAAIALYGKNRGQRLYAMVIFGSPGMADGRCDIGFFNRTMVRKSLPLGKWQTLKVEAADGLVRMKVWADGEAEPAWMVEDELADSLPGLDAIGVRTYGMPIRFDGFKATGTPVAELPPAPALTVGGKWWTAELDRSGRFKSFSGNFGDGKLQPVQFRADSFAGPTWYGRWDGGDKKLRLRQVEAGKPVYEMVRDGIRFRIEYRQAPLGRTAIVATATNSTAKPWKPETAGLQLGLDTWMEKWPDWNQRFFPTLLRCEKTHFWGYAMAPDGRILVIASPDPVASWSVDYNGGGHRIFTLNLDLLNAGPLPARHPQGLDTLAPGESKSWTVYLTPCDKLDDVACEVENLTMAPMFKIDRYTLAAGESFSGTVFAGGALKSLILTDPNGKEAKLEWLGDPLGVYQGTSPTLSVPGVYTLNATNYKGKVSEAKISVRRPWSWYLDRARAEAVAKPQKASSHTESWYGLFSAFQARRLLPDAAMDAQAEAKYQEIMPLMYDMQKMVPTSWQNRIQNHACMAGLLAYRYAATGDIKDLEFAANLADFLGTKQGKDGAYRNGHTHYTSVVYIGKSIMEVMAQEKPLAAKDPKWQERYDRHYASVKKAMDDLAKNLDNIDTEGELTYEDGMIACSYTQLAMFALLQTDPAERQKYLIAAEKVASGHRCLSQIVVPDSRMNGGSLRFWESQYDVLLHPNMFNSPHGWSGWRIYGLYYLYQLTGQEDYLRQAMNALGSCVQLIDGQTGELRWAFVSNPYIRASVFEPDPAKPGKGRHVNQVIGEQYMPMISGWYKAPPKTWVTGYWGDNDGGCCDNDVHEIFKCLAEVAVGSAYVIQRADGTIAAWNCTAAVKDGILVVTPAEALISRIHFNVPKAAKVQVGFKAGPAAGEIPAGLSWFGPGGIPEELR
jgi:hypothetical protein